ncbi:MAG: hypothetical protein LBG48_00035 [Rickettsiales bacterium]|nr:hypothetical protein [Rickettsiales bacterium]
MLHYCGVSPLLHLSVIAEYELAFPHSVIAVLVLLGETKVKIKLIFTK